MAMNSSSSYGYGNPWGGSNAGGGGMRGYGNPAGGGGSSMGNYGNPWGSQGGNPMAAYQGQQAQMGQLPAGGFQVNGFGPTGGVAVGGGLQPQPMPAQPAAAPPQSAMWDPGSASFAPPPQQNQPQLQPMGLPTMSAGSAVEGYHPAPSAMPPSTAQNWQQQRMQRAQQQGMQQAGTGGYGNPWGGAMGGAMYQPGGYPFGGGMSYGKPWGQMQKIRSGGTGVGGQ